MSTEPDATMMNLSEQDYHADRGNEKPSLSSSIIHLLCDSTPLHAWTHHPRLNPDYEPKYADYTDLGTIVHSLILQGSHTAEVLDFPDWRTNASKDARQAARDTGKIPILKHKWANVLAMVEGVQRQLEDHKTAKNAFKNGLAEQSFRWHADGIHFRSRLDYVAQSMDQIWDLKTTGISANPDVFGRQMFANGLDIQAALYRQAVRAFTESLPVFRFVVCETEKPYAVSVIQPDAGVLMLADKKIEYAKELWKRCLDSGVWPGYAPVTHPAELPEWEEKRWLAREEAACL